MNNFKERLKFNLRYPSRFISVPLDKIFSFYYSLCGRKIKLNKELSIVFKKNYITPNAISDHILYLFDFVKDNNINQILELGVNEGFTTKAFLAALSDNDNGQLISIDINDYSKLDLFCEHTFKKWKFIQSCDIEFSNKLTQYLIDKNLSNSFDLLFIDTSHTYFHTYLELILYSKFLSPSGFIILHDSNFGFSYRRKDKSLGFGFNNKDGVYRAIQDFFKISFDKNNFLNFQTVLLKLITYHIVVVLL